MPQKAATEAAEKALREMPDHWLSMIVHYVTGLQNATGQEYSDPIIKPDLSEIYPLFIVQYAVLLIFSVVANVMLLVYILRNRLYIDCTHAFIFNLSVAYLVQSAVVLPATLMVIIIQNWIYGQFMCFFMPLLQDIPMHVAILSNMLIAFDRMRWLGDPMKQRLPSFVCSCATWLTGMIIALPYPIYTTYLDLGLYLPKFRGVGLCAFNLVDDMQEYMRGLFIIMYCAPATILGYLYIRTSRELRPPEGALSVMMFEHRAQLANRERTSSNTPSATRTGTRSNCVRSYDLYDAELDVTREKRTQRHLGAMAAVQMLCICPLMILRIARMVLVETYENSIQFDITYLLFVWTAFLPTFINPCIYVAWVLPRHMKEQLLTYLRLSSPSCTKLQDTSSEPRTSEVSTTQEVVTESGDDYPFDKHQTPGKSIISPTTSTTGVDPTTKPRPILQNKVNQSSYKSGRGINRSTEVRPPASDNRLNSEFSGSLKDRLAVAGLMDRTNSQDVLRNSCSNMTTSTYCNGADPYHNHRSADDRDGYPDGDIKNQRRLSRTNIYDHPLRASQDRLRTSHDSDLASILVRRESSSTYERDMDIIDLLQRERSMEIPEMLERERRTSGDEPKMRSLTRQNSSFERKHRRLPDITRLASVPMHASTKKLSSEPHFPNQVFTYPNPMGQPEVIMPSARSAMVATAVLNQSSRPTSQVYHSPTKRDSVHSVGKVSMRSVDMEGGTRGEYRNQRLVSTHSNQSSSSGRSASMKGRRDYRDSVFATNL